MFGDDVLGLFGPPRGPEPAQNAAQKHSFLGTKYRPNRPNGDPIGGHFSFLNPAKIFRKSLCAQKVYVFFLPMALRVSPTLFQLGSWDPGWQCTRPAASLPAETAGVLSVAPLSSACSSSVYFSQFVGTGNSGATALRANFPFR